jgi:Outer membrane protein beta-barrel domain
MQAARTLACDEIQAEPSSNGASHAERCGPPLRPVMGGEWMIGKFASARALTALILLIFLTSLGGAAFLPARASAQTPTDQSPGAAPATGEADAQQPQPQTPAAQQSGNEEESPEETPLPRQKKPRDYNKWSYNVGAGAAVYGGTTKTFVRGGGVGGTVGVARNANKYFGLRGDFMYQDLPLKQSSLLLAQAGSANTYVLSFMVDPVINIPVSNTYGGYVLFGPGYFHRGGTLNSDLAVPGSGCTAFWTWWKGICPNDSLPLDGSFIHSSQNDFGYNVGAGITRKMPSGVQIYAEFRLIHGSANGTTTDVRPITVGVRW